MATPQPPSDEDRQSAHDKVRLTFVVTMATYLLFTAALKLVALTIDAPVLRAHDSLLKTLTVRQVILAAALLEIIIASAVLHFRRSSKTPWLLLWLAMVFGLYRAGLWHTGFQGHCPCLGHLLDWSTFLSEMSDAVTLCSIGVMGFGSILVLTERYWFRKVNWLRESRRQ